VEVDNHGWANTPQMASHHHLDRFADIPHFLLNFRAPRWQPIQLDAPSKVLVLLVEKKGRTFPKSATDFDD
jgi:hypothetical protein